MAQPEGLLIQRAILQMMLQVLLAELCQPSELGFLPAIECWEVMRQRALQQECFPALLSDRQRLACWTEQEPD